MSIPSTNVSGNGNPSPTIRECALAIETQMNVFAKPRGGSVEIMENEAHLWEKIYNGGLISEQPRILILCAGAKARGEYDGDRRTNLEREDRKWQVYVGRGHGFKSMTAENRGVPGTPGYYESFDDTIETIRDGLRILSNITVDDIVNYKGWRPVGNIGPSPAANVFLDWRVVEFETAGDCPSVASMTQA